MRRFYCFGERGHFVRPLSLALVYSNYCYNWNPMSLLRLQLVAKQDIAVGTQAFYFKRPDGFSFQAGQYMDLTVLNAKEMDNGGPTRTFSIASAPHEEYIMIATRMQDSAFKRALGTMRAGDMIEATPPTGTFTLHDDPARTAIFIAGGMGITLPRSIILDAIHRGLPHRMTLFYSTRTEADAAFLDELRDTAAAHPHFVLVPVVTRGSSATSRINADLIHAHIKEAAHPMYYLAGSLAMVTAMRELLEDMGVDGDDVRGEEFAGY